MVGRIKAKKTDVLIVLMAIGFTLLYGKLSPKLFLLGLVGFVGLIAVFYDIRLGLIGGVIAMPVLPDTLNILYMIFLVGVLVFNLLFKKDKQLNKMPMDLIWILFAILIVFATFTSRNPSGSFRDFAIHISGIGFLLVMVNSVENKNQFNVIATFLVFAASLVALYGLYQYVVGVEIDRAWVDVANNPDMKVRVYSVFGNPNILAEYLIMIIPISVGLFWHSKKLLKKLIFLGTSLIMSLALVLTMSRGGWIGFAMSALIFIVLVEKRLLLSLIPISIGGVYLLPESIMNRILSITNFKDSSNAYRFKIWEITSQIIRDHKMIGVGFGYLPFKETYVTYIRTMSVSHAHNTYLQILAETGIIGFSVFLAFFVVLFKYAYIDLIKSGDSYIRTMAAGLIAGIGALLTQGIVENVFYMPKIILTFWILVSFIFTLSKIKREEATI